MNNNNVKRLTLWTFILGVMFSLMLSGPFINTVTAASFQVEKTSSIDVQSRSVTKSTSLDHPRDAMTKLSSQQSENRTSSTTRFGNITITTNASRYFPGETMNVNVRGPIDELNGTMEWRLFTPLNESLFGFDLLRFLLLQNFDFEGNDIEGNDISEWTNDTSNPFDSITISNGYLNLTELADNDTNPARVYVNKTNVNLTALTVSFDYLGLTPNLVQNASFEAVDAWSFNSTLVSQSNESAHSGTFALFANKTPSNTVVASQNVTVPANTTLIISAWGTGINSSSQWLFRITAFNSTGHVVGSPKNSSLSTTLDESSLENGFGMIETTFSTPPHTSYVQIELIGINSTENGTYTGYFDDVAISIAPPSGLEFQYYNGTNWVNVTGFKTNTHKWNRFQTTIRINSTAANGTIFALVLPDESTNVNDPAVSWLLDNFTFVKITPPIGRLSTATEIKTGSVNATRIFRVDDQVKNETLVSFYEYLFKEIDGTPTVLVNFTLTLPREQVYYGPHALDIIFYPNITAGSETSSTSQVVLSHLIYIVDEFRFEPLQYYALRGSASYTYNDTELNQNVTIEQVFYENETDTRIFSPGDNVTILGFIIPTSTERLFNKTTALDTSFYQLENGHARFEWQGVTENITWGTNGDSVLRTYSSTAKDIAHGNFTIAFPQVANYTKFVAINFVIPSRGIFGSVNSTLFFDFKRTLSTEGHGFNTSSASIAPYTVNITLPELKVKFRLNVTQSVVPSKTTFVPLQSIDGTFTIDPLHARDDLLEKYQNASITLNNGTKIVVNRTIVENITNFVPLSDLHFRLFLDASGKGNFSSYDEGIDIPIRIDRVKDKFSWFYKFSPNDLNGTYVARITWLEADKANDTALKYLAFNKNGTLPTEFTIEFKVDLLFNPFYDAGSTIKIKHGDVLSLNFTFIIAELGNDFYIPGVRINARIDDNESIDVPVIENNGIYVITLGTRTLSVGTHTIKLIHATSGEILATIEFTVTPNPSLTNPPDRFTPLAAEDLVTTLLSTIIVGASALIAIVLVAFLPRYLASRRQ